MAHRGRINVLTHILGKPYATIFGEFDGKHAAASAESETGDVKYHLGARTERTLADGRTIGIQLVPNPSHLEVVNPVVSGVTTACGLPRWSRVCCQFAAAQGAVP